MELSFSNCVFAAVTILITIARTPTSFVNALAISTLLDQCSWDYWDAPSGAKTRTGKHNFTYLLFIYLILFSRCVQFINYLIKLTIEYVAFFKKLCAASPNPHLKSYNGQIIMVLYETVTTM